MLFDFAKNRKSLNRDTCVFINKVVEKKAGLEIKGGRIGEEGMKKEGKKEVLWKK